MSNATSIEAVIFDLGGVFVGLDFSRMVRHAAKATGRTEEDVQRRLFGKGDPLNTGRAEYMHDYECGRIDDAEFHSCIEGTLEATLHFETFKAGWNDIFTGPVESTVQLAVALRRQSGLKLGLLSNTNHLHWKRLRPEFPLFETFDQITLSYLTGLRKPFPEIYKHTLEQLNVRPERAVFVDDLEENVRAAERVGMMGIHAVDAGSVRLGLERLGVPC